MKKRHVRRQRRESSMQENLCSECNLSSKSAEFQFVAKFISCKCAFLSILTHYFKIFFKRKKVSWRHNDLSRKRAWRDRIKIAINCEPRLNWDDPTLQFSIHYGKQIIWKNIILSITFHKLKSALNYVSKKEF